MRACVRACVCNVACNVHVMLSALTSDGCIERCWTPWDDFGISLYDLLYSIFSNCICSASYSISYAIL